MEGADRARALLGVRRWGDEIAEAPPEPAAADLGADGAIGYRWRSNSVHAAVYAFDSHASARAAEDLVKGSGATGRHVAATANGALLLVATAAGDDPAGQDVLGELRSSFAGRERDRE